MQQLGVELKDEVLEAVQHRGDWCTLGDVYDAVTTVINRHSIADVWDALQELEQHGQVEGRYTNTAQWRALFEGTA